MSNFSESDQNKVNKIIKNSIITDAGEWGRRFNRYQLGTPYFGVTNTREYLFFTKPDLHIMNSGVNINELNPELANRYFWIEMRQRYRRVISDLQASAARSNNERDGHIFIPMLTNAVNSSLELPSSTADTTETGSTIYGTNIQYRKGSHKSDENYDFSLDFIDMPGLDVYHFFKMWDEYENLKDLGVVSPPTFTEKVNRIYSYNQKKNKDKNSKEKYTSTNDTTKNTGLYRSNKILHDQIAIYKFVVDGADGETIIHYSKLIGCFPKSVPRDAFSNFKGEGLIQYSVDWHAQFVEDMNPEIIIEFNALCQAYFKANSINDKGANGSINSNILAPLIKNKLDMVNASLVRHPVICKEFRTSADSNTHHNNAFPLNKTGGFVYKLKWVKAGDLED